MKRTFGIASLIALWIGLALACQRPQQLPEDSDMDTQWVDSSQHIYQFGICIDSLDVQEHWMRNGDNPAAIFARLGFSGTLADSINRASAVVLDPTKLRAGMPYYTFTSVDSTETIRHIAFAKTLTDYAIIDLYGDSISAHAFSKPITLKRKYAEGVLNSSLWNAIKASGDDPFLAIKLSDV